MIRYVPFLKAKRGELTAIGALASNVKQDICPFFDFPRKKEDYDSEDFASKTHSIATGLNRHWGTESELYFDDLDIGQKLTVDGEHHYGYALKALKKLKVVPVVALDRTSHNAVVAKLKSDGEIASDTVAFRAVHQHFEDFKNSEDQIDYDLANVFQEFESIDLILDCRLCTGLNVVETARQIADFARKFCSTYNVRRIVVTGSSIPASIRDVLATNSNCTLQRKELDILKRAKKLTSLDLITGDYATVSPFYSDTDLDPIMMQKIMTARLAYTLEGLHYFVRGSSVGTDGYEQYCGLAYNICGQSFFRGPSYSLGDKYLYQKSQSLGNNCTPGAAVKPLIVAHITYMVLDAIN